ncbi:MAG: exosortase system-associated protein, TIGR04073 family [Verrucomicrobiota bacterium]
MKKFVVIATALITFAGFAAADIQSPPGAKYTSGRKLGRAISNILYGVVEIPEQIARKNDAEGRKVGWSYGVIDGTNRALRRFGYGFYELFTFTCPTYRGSFKPPYERCGEDNRIEMNVADGLSEFPPELGFETYFKYARTQGY